jgi:hypothetical protein
MEDYGDQTKNEVGYRTLKIAILALACLGLFMVLVSLVSHNASAVPVPAMTGMTISSDTTWDSGSASWYGTLTVNSPAKLTIKDCTISATYLYIYVNNGATLQMNNVTMTISSNSQFYFYSTVNIVDTKITMNNYNYFYLYNPTTTTILNSKISITSSYMYFYAWDYAKLNIKGSTIEHTSSMSIYMYLYGYAQVRIDSSFLKYVYYLYCYGYDVQITNTSIVNAYFGVYAYTYGSSNWGSPGPIIKNCLITSSYYPIYAYMWGNGNAKVVMEGNLIISNQYYVYIYGGGNFIFNNNTVIKNNNDGIYLYQVTVNEFNNNNIQSNSGVGLRMYFQNSELVIRGNTFLGNAGGDIWLYSAKIRSVDNIIGKVSCQQGSELNVYWLLSVYVVWEDGTGPVADAAIEFLDSMKAGVIPADITGADGWLRNVEVKEYSWNDKGQQKYSPYQLNITKFDCKVTTNVTVDTNTEIKVILDNVPPILQLESPVNKLLTNKNLISVKGLTEPGVYCTVNGKAITVQASGWFETEVNYTTDGSHDIKVACMDASKNSKDLKRTIIIDTKAPILKITNPVPETLTNDENIVATGETEPGTFAEINGKTVSVDNNGKFSRALVMDEGDNTIFFKVWDKAGNTREANVTISVDSVAPTLAVLDPKDRSRVSTQDIKIVGFIEDNAILNINGQAVRFQGMAFQYNLRLAQGENTITIEAWDKAGNYNSKELVVTLDQKPPALTILTPTENMFTNQKMVLVSGITDPGNTVTISGDVIKVDQSTGYFERSCVLKSGANKFNILATDSFGNSVARSVTVVQDTEAPSLTILTPDDETITNHDTIKLEGITELGASLTVNGKEVTVDKGKFMTYVTLDEGWNEILVISRDDALNSKSAKVNVMKDTTVDLRVAFPYDGMYTTESAINITGSSEAGSLVYINKNLKTSMDMYGGFKAQLGLELGSNDISISATDSLGNTKTITMVVTREQPTAPPPVKHTQNTSSSGVLASPWMMAVAMFLGLIVGAAIMGGVYISTRRRMEENTRDQIEELLSKRFEEKRAEEARLAVVRASAPPVVPRGYKGPPIHIEKPAPAAPQSTYRPSVPTTAQATAPPGPIEGPAPTSNLTSVQGETMAPAEDSVMEIDPQVAAAEQRVRNAEAAGKDTSKARNSLKLAKFFMSKGDTEKMGKYLQKTNEVLDEIGA